MTAKTFLPPSPSHLDAKHASTSVGGSDDDISAAMNVPRTSRTGRAVIFTLAAALVILYTFGPWSASPYPIVGGLSVNSNDADAPPGRAGAARQGAREGQSADQVQSLVVDGYEQQNISPASLVPFEAHIISKCPDTRDALRELILPVMERVSDKVDFKLSYIGKATASDGVDCLHGPSECMGNIIELCARELYPDPKISLGFVMCLTRDYKHIPERSLIEDCSLEHAIDFEALNECATRDDGAHGVGILRESVKRTSEAGVTKSCTIRLDNEIYCIRDGGEWKDCPHGPGVNDLVIAIERLYRRGSSADF